MPNPDPATVTAVVDWLRKQGSEQLDVALGEEDKKGKLRLGHTVWAAVLLRTADAIERGEPFQ